MTYFLSEVADTMKMGRYLCSVAILNSLEVMKDLFAIKHSIAWG